ncbi:RND efflux system outer membrane lipoprotein [Rahnella aquatilis CIP 78.65 = ATCC 33071]|uniref:Efflux transporter, outer membrane factor lipoprotein, NodT family n=1 Tax=Rahnella aquatilis (strain ATCC 33071 / DSM 4594 / JCM 1683 / NBRC 105701 / NCIMB 13365 / CIP 78.65) TaxID=745277 RepID=H2ITW2_RAHAC|nr:efflux transporter outer membrane subunit [Rahnella aquatilis]AEX51618.1 efflux transporter, outer membrane factor lipoprotein, NodT family [Rahnella aquatilis CIP 78.65 = ATCC 33071]KFD16650.1 RND efflux system outer membrane lipoprotein [Rahnella aquatilis CIP 78.65 = ATCC 33071]
MSYFIVSRTLRLSRRALTPVAAMVFATLFTGCTLTPEYHRPTAPMPPVWPVKTKTSVSDTSVASITWQTLFIDPKLRQVVQLALDNNRDLRIAILNIEKAQAQYRIQRSALMPQVGITGAEQAQRTPASVSYTGIGGVSRGYSLDVGISAYELDLFGRIRSLKEEAQQDYLSTAWSRQATQISLIAEVAGSYLSLAADQDLQRLARDTLRSRQEAYDLQESLTSVGKSSQLPLHQAESELESARFQSLLADKQVMSDSNALALLVGTPLPANLLPSTDSLAHMISDKTLSAGLPSDLLQQRPDIVSTEHSLLAANADIGAARAAFFPSISLTTSAGRASNALGELFDAGGQSWGFAPQVNLPIFSGGRLMAQLETSKVERDIAVAEYEKSVQTAFREVSDALAERSVVDDETQAQQKNVQAAQAAFDFVQIQYANGATDYLNVLDAQRTLFSAQQSLIQSRLSQQNSLITLYKALGGGWERGAVD